MTNPESPDYAALLKGWEWMQEFSPVDDAGATCAEVGLLLSALRALLKERDARLTEKEAENIRHDRNEAMKLVDSLQSKLEQYDKALNGISGASVYRKSHEHISKELGAVRVFAAAERERIRKL